jgi:hypothetical protein
VKGEKIVKILAKAISVIVFSILCVNAGSAQTSFYVDPTFTGGGRSGTQSAPWQSLSDSGAWSAINSALGSGNVTVFFSATASSTVPVGLGSRSDASSHMLTLDGISRKNSSGSWTTNVNPTPCKYDAPSCSWASAARFTITATTPIAGSDSANNCKNYFTIQGFTFRNTEGQSADLTYTGNLTFQYNDLSRVATGSYGPGVIIGPANQGPGCGGTGPNNVTLQYNHIHQTWGECLYIGASTPDPPGNGDAHTGDNYLIQGNVNESCASWGGQGDGMDIKDGHTNLRVRNNTIRPSRACTSCGSNGPGNDGQGIVFESATLLDGNYVETPNHNCFTAGDAWNNTIGRSSVTLRNNIAVNCNSGVGQNNGIAFFSPSVTAKWVAASLYNNSIFRTGDNCISIQSGNPTGFINVQNNICHSTNGGVSGGSMLATHDYNDYFNAGVGCPVSGESHSMCSDPEFVSTATPYVDTNFALKAGSPVESAGANLSGMFTNDYFGATRTTPWDMSAVSMTAGLPPPSGLAAAVH